MNTALNQRDSRNPEVLLERLASLSREACRGGRFRNHELYHRASTAVRVARIGSDSETRERIGDEEGTAIRLRLAGEAGFRFAATTGSGQTAIDQSIRLALGAPGGIVSHAEVRGSVAEPLVDHDVGEVLPSLGELRDWLDEGLVIFRDSRRPGEETEPDEAWVEVASTVETWAIDGRPVASRTRQRGWALLRPAPSRGASFSPRPALVAARSWSRITVDRWAEARNLPVTPEEVAVEGSSQSFPVLFDPETSATVAMALVRSVQTGPGPTGSKVGPGWRVWNAPDASDSLFGGVFDDAGIDSTRIQLADGERLVGRIDGGGYLRRPSFRDPPRPLPSHLLVDPRERVESPDVLRVNRISIHPLPTGQWILDLGGAFITTTPDELLQSCVAGVGPDRSSHRGVTTPALLFDGLTVRT